MSQQRAGGYAGQQVIGKNMSNEEYLQALERQNQLKKDREAENKELQQRKKLEEREKGFNVYNSVAKTGGALAPGQGREPQREARGARRQWRDPSKSNERGSQSRSPINSFGQRQPPTQGNRAYHNPFDLNQQNQSFADKTNPSALINVFNTRKQDHIDRDSSPSDMGQQIQIKERVANPNRKKWGSRAGADQHTQQRQQIEMNEFDRDDGADGNMAREAQHPRTHEKPEDDNDEDDYSDDDFEQQVEAGQDMEDESEALQIIHESTNESRDHSELHNHNFDDRIIVDIYDDEPDANKLSGSAGHNSSSAHIEQFLKTATAKDMDIIRESLSNFQEVSKNFSNQTTQPKNKDRDDDYIEEEFEEEIPEDHEESDASNEEHKFEVIKKEQATANQNSKASAKGRPVSAVYDLSQFRAGPNTGMQSQRTLHQGNPAALNANGQSQTPGTVKRGPGPKYGFEASSGAADMAQDAMQARGFETNAGVGRGAHQGSAAQFGSFQPNKPSILSNVFKRPFSEVNPGKRQNQKGELNKQFLRTDVGGQQTMPGLDSKLQESMQFNYQTQAGITLRDADNIDASYGGHSQASRVSQRDSELHQIMQAITQLDDSQRADLLSVLRDKRAAGLSGAGSLAGSSRGAAAFGHSAPRAGQSLGYASSNYTATGRDYPSNLSQNAASRTQMDELNAQHDYDDLTAEKHAPKAALAYSKNKQDRTRNELILRILSTHGDPHLCGLTEIELFDSAAKKIVVLPTNVTVRNIGRHGTSGASSGIQMSTKALVNGCKFTNEHRNMWIGSLPLPQHPPIYIEVVIHFALSSDLAAVKIWNYNKSVRDGTKGIRDVEILLNDELKFEGVVKMGRGQVKEDYSELISIKDGVQVEQECLAGAEESGARNREERQVPVGAGNVSFSADTSANQIGEMRHLTVHQGNHADAPASTLLQTKQQVSDYRTDYVARALPPGTHVQQHLVNSNSMQLMQGSRRNIDVIRQRNRNEESRSRSRSPFNDFGKPVWLQSNSNQNIPTLPNSKSTRLFAGAGTERQGLLQSKSKEKLNRRQAEQQQRIEQDNEINSNSSLRANADISNQQQVMASAHKQALQPAEFRQQDGLRNMLGQEEEPAQSTKWPSKGPNRGLENNKSNYGVAEQIFNASELVKNAVSSVNQAVKVTDDQHRGYQKSHERGRSNQKDSEPAKAPAKRIQDAQHMIEESLDSFDFFKVTNLGRINNDLGQQNHQRMSKQRGQESENKRAKWGAKATGTDSARQASNLSTNPSKDQPGLSGDLDTYNPGSMSTANELAGSQTVATEISQHSNQSGKDSVTKSSYKAPRLMKSPFPDEFCLPSPALSNKKSASRASIKREKEGDGSRLRDTDHKVEEEDDFLKDLDLDERQIVAKKAPPIASLDDTFEIELKKYEQPKEMVTPPVPKQIHAEKTQEQTFTEKLRIFGSPFVIPNLPRGTHLEFNILQTWGDSNYLGLTGIEIFDAEGCPISINGETDIKANPCDINLLMGYGTDPRTVDKLVDGNYFTNDDFHAWLTPFTQGEDHTISIKLPQQKQIAMIRIWNYNKSRIHSFRGARLLTCQLDGKMIFKGEIARAPGNTKDPAACCEIILFTDDDDILTQIDHNDWLNQIQLVSDSDDANTNIDSGNDMFRSEQNRPMTATKKFGEDEVKQLQFALNKPTSMFDERPQTKAIRRQNPPPMRGGDDEDDRPNYELEDFKPQIIKKKNVADRQRTGGIKGRVIELNIAESWGDLFYVGLNGIEVYDVDQKKIELEIKNLDANPRDMNSIPGHGQDHRTLDKLINGANNTIDDRNMWLVPFNSGEDHTVKIDLGRMTMIGSIKFYNYNKSSEDSLRGVKQVIIKVDGKLVTPNKGITLRKAPGFILPSDDLMCNDIGQHVLVPFADGWKSNMILPLQKQVKNSSSQVGLQQEYEPVSMPIGFNFRINLYSTHGDNYYIGLNGIELYDQLGDIVSINAKEQAMVNPAGINRVPGMENDVRTLDKLFNGKNQMFDDRNMWLAPFKFTRSHAAANSSQQNSDKREPNFISVIFDQPTAVSAVRLWNYSKTATRGAHEFEIVVDDKPIYRGFAKKAPDSQEEWQQSIQKDFSTVVLFTHEHRIVERFKNNIDFDAHKQQEVLMFNEKKQVNPGQVKQRPNEKFVFNENERPTTKYGGR